MLESKKVRLRAVERVDLPIFVKWINDPEVTQFLELNPPMSLEDEEKWFVNLQKSEDKVFSIDTKEGKLIGNVGLIKLNWKDRSVLIGIMIGEKEFWNLGYGTDAIETLLRYLFYELAMNRVYLIADERNARALHCYEKLGFKKEGILRQNRYKNGVYTNDVMMSLLKDEWKEK
ncbi:MAG: GNAT family N-acetyltransferase [Methanomassiliicoccales archaeon]|jgi:RimJ/RimL family protein N-acetyltransferase|nr:GNAT family N-acetyltransferase [Methanomassiliicoccales archaeon]